RHGDRRTRSGGLPPGGRQGERRLRWPAVGQGHGREDPGRQMRPAVERWLGWLDHLMLALLGACLLVLVLVGGGQILLRELAGIPLPWATEFSVVLMIWATMLTGYVGVRRDSHLSADFLGLAMSDRKRALLRTLALLLSLVFVAVYGWES